MQAVKYMNTLRLEIPVLLHGPSAYRVSFSEGSGENTLNVRFNSTDLIGTL